MNRVQGMTTNQARNHSLPVTSQRKIGTNARPAPASRTNGKTAPVKENKSKGVEEAKRPRRTLREMSRDIEDEPARPIRRGWWQAEAQRERRMEMQHERRMEMMERNAHRRMFGGLGF